MVKNTANLQQDRADDDPHFSVSDLIDFLWLNPDLQNPSGHFYKACKVLLEDKFNRLFNCEDLNLRDVLGIDVAFPSISMGKISSQHLFGIDELLIFKFYSENRHRYNTVCDIGCNLGLHSAILCELGYTVTSYEPDPNHFEICSGLLAKYPQSTAVNAAVSNYSGQAKFTRILDNTTGSYINKKKQAYGPVEEFSVSVVDSASLASGFDLFKIDAEGSEIDILSSLKPESFDTSDFILELSTEISRRDFWELLSAQNLNAYSQMNSWRLVTQIDELPTSHKQGSVFVSRHMPGFC